MMKYFSTVVLFLVVAGFVWGADEESKETSDPSQTQTEEKAATKGEAESDQSTATAEKEVTEQKAPAKEPAPRSPVMRGRRRGERNSQPGRGENVPVVRPSRGGPAEPDQRRVGEATTLQEASVEASVSSQKATEAVAEKKAEPKITITMPFSDMGADVVFFTIGNKFGVNITPHGSVASQKISMILKDNTLEQVLDKLVANNDWVWEKVDDKSYEIWTRKDYESVKLPTKTIEKTFSIKYISAEEVASNLQKMLTKGIGSIAYDNRTNKLFVKDLPQVIEQIQRYIDEIDVKMVTRVFYIRHANVKDVADTLENIKSPPGRIEFDEKSHQIIATDNFQTIKRMELLVEVLDVGRELKIFEINALNEDELQDLVSLIEQVVTQDALLEIDIRNGLLIIEDIPEIVDKVAQIIEAFDRPDKQVQIEMEIIEVSLSKDLAFGTEFDLSGDLFGAIADGILPATTAEGAPVSVPVTEIVTQIFDEDGDVIEESIERIIDGFTNISDEFPTIQLGGSGLTLQYVSTHFRAKIMAALKISSEFKMLLNPRIMVKNHETATIDVGGEKPYQTSYYSTDSSDSYVIDSQSSVRYGLHLEVTPHISNNGLVELELKIENNDAQILEGSNLVEKITQEVSTTLIIPNGETRVIGGLITTKDTESKSGIPFLCEIPVIGPFLFGSSSKTTERKQLLIFLTPVIVEEVGGTVREASVKEYEELAKEYEALMGEKMEEGLLSVVGTEELLPPSTLIPSDDVYTSPSQMISAQDLLSDGEPEPLPDIDSYAAEGIVLPTEKDSSYDVRVGGLSGSLSSPAAASSRSSSSKAARPTVRKTPTRRSERGSRGGRRSGSSSRTETRY